MDRLLSILRLDALKGSRTQWTILAGLLLNALVSLGILKFTPDQVDTVNKFLAIIAGYFFAEKVSK